MLQVLTFVCINIILAMTIYMTLCTGILSLGNAGLMSFGAYTSAILTAEYNFPMPLGILLGGCTATIVALIIGLPTIRLRGLYLAIATLGFADRDSERMLAGSRGEIPAEARLARLWVDGPVPGDVMCPLGMSGRSKKVSDLLNEARIPVSERAGVPVVRTAPGGAVVWVAGVRTDERFKCTAATRVAYLLRVVDAE